MGFGLHAISVFSAIAFCLAGCATARPARQSGGDACNQLEALAAYRLPADFAPGSEARMWTSCLSIFRCSPSASYQLEAIRLDRSVKPRIRFFEWEADSSRRPGAPIDALYHPGSGTVLLSDHPRPLGEVCSDLYHELIHRLDSPAGRPAGSMLRLEYNAFYFQQLYEAELMTGDGPLGRELRQDRRLGLSEIRERLLSREEILRRISVVYRLPLDLGLRDRLPAYPWENGQEIVEGPVQLTAAPGSAYKASQR